MTQDPVDRDDEAKARRTRVLDEKRNVTSRISDTARYIGFGLLAVYYTSMSGDSAFAVSLRAGLSKYLLHAMGFAGAAAILFDYLQYLFGARSVEEALADPGSEYNPRSCAYKAREMFFTLKQWAVGVGAILLIVLVFSAAVGRSN